MAIITVLSEILCEVDMEIFKSYEIWMIVGAALLIILYYYHREKKKVHNAKEKELLKKGDMHECFWEVLSGGYFPVLFFFMSLGNITGLAYLFPVAIAVVLVIAIVMQVKIYVCKEELVSRSGWSYEEAVLEKKKNILESAYNIVYAVIVPITILFISYGTCSSYYSVPKSFCILLFAIIVITVAAIMQCKRFNYKKKMRKYQMAKKEGLCMEELQIDKKSSLRELVYYCTEPEPVGALMFTGEWGCGKTYLIDHELKATFDGQNGREEKVIIRVSLFGVSSVENIHSLVKESWMEAYYENFPTVLKKTTRFLKNIQSSIAKMEGNDEMKLLASVGLSNFMRVKNIINKKPVILVFDDLERCQMDRIDVLGCINDYCENQGFNTIIVANEEKIKDRSDNELSYREIKEKIVQRVIPFVPDYEEVVSNSIELMSCGIEYKGLLRKNEKLLVKILSGDFNDNAIIEQYKAKNYKLGSNKEREECQKEEEELRKLLAQRPHNIRSFKCAIQDFERVYNKLVKEDIQDCSNWLLSFTCLMMTNKAGLLQEITRYGHLFWYLNVEKLYPELFDDNFIVDGFSKWVIQGEWNEDVISKEIQLFLKKEKAATPLEILRTYNLPEVDEEIIDEGFKDLLIEVYAGNLSLDEYILFLYNCCYSRMYDFDLPTIDWEKVREGIRKQIKYLVESDEKDSHSHRMIGDDSKEHFTEDEWSAYQIIKEFRDNNVWIYEKNQKLYIDFISSDLDVAFRDLSNKRYNKFSLEMEAATINAFKNADNMDKKHFSGWFVGIWGQYSHLPEIDGQVTTASLKKLRDDLNSVMQEYKEKGKNIAAGHTQNFIKKLEAIIKTESEDTTVEQ